MSKTADGYLSEIYKEIGIEGFPIQVDVSAAGALENVQYSTEWKEGGTSPVTDKNGNIVGYKENYKERKLTKEQIKKIDAYITENIKSE